MEGDAGLGTKQPGGGVSQAVVIREAGRSRSWGACRPRRGEGEHFGLRGHAGLEVLGGHRCMGTPHAWGPSARDTDPTHGVGAASGP